MWETFITVQKSRDLFRRITTTICASQRTLCRDIRLMHASAVSRFLSLKLFFSLSVKKNKLKKIPSSKTFFLSLALLKRQQVVLILTEISQPQDSFTLSTILPHQIRSDEREREREERWLSNTVILQYQSRPPGATTIWYCMLIIS